MALQDKSTTQALDSFFRGVSPGWYVTDDGTVEAPTGWFGLLRIDTEFRQAHSSTSIKRENSEMPEGHVPDGLYLVIIENSGVVWAYHSETEAEVLNRYAEMSREYSEWLASYYE